MPESQEVRATADQMLEIIDELRSVEERKRSIAIGAPEFVQLAEQAVEDARLAFRWSQLQLQIAQAAAARVARGELPADIQVDQIEPRKLDVVLALWREAQMRFESAAPGSVAAAEAAEAVERLREEYQAIRERVSSR